MIRLVQGRHRHQFSREVDEMFSIRKRVFLERMHWDVTCINRWEIDGYDALDPLYVLSLNEDARVVGGVRLLPTTGFNMLNDTFSVLLPEGERIENPRIWESSRFSVDHEADALLGPKGVGRATAELILAMNEVGERLGLSHIVTVYDALMHRMLSRIGCAGEPIGEPVRIGKVLTYAVFVEIGDAIEKAVKAASGIEGSVLETETARYALAA
ncbi:MAG TPA: acyl-homoserine-lactone synthase [Methylocystis sp.]|nr:acyl-homoserine-lactone synthase [Methylocystis sp.]